MRTMFRTAIIATPTIVLLGIACASKAAAQRASFNPAGNEAVRPLLHRDKRN